MACIACLLATLSRHPDPSSHPASLALSVLQPDAFLVQMSNLTPLEISYCGVRSILNDTMAAFLAMESPEDQG